MVDGCVYSGSTVQDGSAGAAMGIGVAGFGLRNRSGSGSRSRSCIGNGSEEGEDDRGSDGLHFARIGDRYY